MNKENNRSAAGLRRSAVAARLQLREEWSALKEVDGPTTSDHYTLKKKPVNSRCTPTASNRKKQVAVPSTNKGKQPMQVTSDALTGVVALVDVGSEAKALPLRAALTALGATVVPAWSPLVTHLVWTDNGTRAIRSRARALACRLVSPLWVEACAAAGRKLREGMFPAASRQSDLPSPRTLRLLLKKAERENVPLVDLLSDSKEDEKEDMPRLRLRISSGTDTSREKTIDSSNDTVGLESRVNTAPRRGVTSERAARPATGAPATRPPTGAPVTKPSVTRPGPKSRRKLFTHKEAQDISSDEDSDTTNNKRQQQNKLTQSERRDLARAERMAKKLLAACDTQRTNNNNIVHTQHGLQPRIVLTGMSRIERHAITKCIQKLGGVIQNKVNKRTTHVLLGSCNSHMQCNDHGSNITGVSTHCDLTKSSCWTDSTDRGARTVSSLLGAARGARVLHARWAAESAGGARWCTHHGYEVMHLRRIAQKAKVERAALGRLNLEYAYDVFSGMRVHVRDDAEQRDAAIQLLTLCGAVVQNGGATSCQNGRLTGRENGALTSCQNGRLTGRENGALTSCQNGRLTGRENGALTSCQNGDSDVVIGNSVGEVNSKWVFDSVAAARMRTTRRYVNMNSFSEQEREHR